MTGIFGYANNEIVRENFMKNSAHGFTLIELLVVISILAVLAVIGFAIFSGLAGKGNDTKRSSDIKAIADALEIKRTNTSGAAVYQTIGSGEVVDYFSAGVIPVDPNTARVEKYCYRGGVAALTNPVPNDWNPVTPVVCPTNWTVVPAAGPLTMGATHAYFKVCALNEAKTAAFCVGSKQ